MFNDLGKVISKKWDLSQKHPDRQFDIVLVYDRPLTSTYRGTKSGKLYHGVLNTNRELIGWKIKVSGTRKMITSKEQEFVA